MVPESHKMPWGKRARHHKASSLKLGLAEDLSAIQAGFFSRPCNGVVRDDAPVLHQRNLLSDCPTSFPFYFIHRFRIHGKSI